MPLKKLGPAKNLAAYSHTVFSLLKGLTCLPAFGLMMSTAAVIGHPVLSNSFIKHTVPISGRLGLLQATMISTDRKLEGWGLKQQEAEKKIEDLEITDSPDTIITENTAALKNVINGLENNLR